MDSARTADRLARMATKLVDRFRLDLSGLVVLTEAASGPYLGNPVFAAMARADQVYAYTKDSSFGSADDIERDTMALASSCGVADRLKVIRSLPLDVLGSVDIVTNSGHLRPIDCQLLAQLKSTAVVPLMWETWEFQGTEIDLPCARKLGILVLGTREDRPPCDMRPYGPLFATKLLLQMGIPVVSSSILVVGSQHTLAVPIVHGLRQLGAEITWCGDGHGADRPLRALRECCLEHRASIDAIVIAEHKYPNYIIGPDGLISPDEIACLRKGIPIGVITGRVDAAALRAKGIEVHPEVVLEDGRMSYQASQLGPQPVLELFAAGLKVGEAMARARIAGLDLSHAARIAIERSPAMDFEGENAWIK